MANINLYEAYNNKRRKYGVNDSSRYQQAFVEATNMAFADFNAEVFCDDTLEYIRSFNDVINSRLISLNTITFDANSLVTMGNREFWAVEYVIERTSDTNSMTDTISDDNSNVVIAIANNVLQFQGDSLTFTVTLPDTDSYRLLISSNKSGYTVVTDDTTDGGADASIDLDYIPDLSWVPDLELVPIATLGDSSTSQKIGTVSSRVISSVSGLNIVSTAFYSSKTKLLEWLMDEGTGTTITDEINSYTATVDTPVWNTVWVEESCALDQRYQQYFNAALEYYLQEGNEWGIEPDINLERRWFGRALPRARATYQQNSTYANPLGI